MYAGIRVFVFEVSSQILFGLKVALVAGITTARPRATALVIRPVLGLDMLAGIGHTVRTAWTVASVK